MLKIRKKLLNESGFTLIEVIIVVIILGVLSGIALINFGGLDTQAKDARVQADFRTIATALKAYKALVATGTFPAALNDLCTDSGNYHALLDSVPIDPYTNAAYGYTNPDPVDPNAVDVTSGSTTFPQIVVK